MIVDEALAVGDMNFQSKCMTALTRIQDRGATVLFVSHDIGSLKSLCSRGIYLDYGAIQKIGYAGEVAELYVRRMREEINADFVTTKPLQVANTETKYPSKAQESSNTQEFKISKTFEKQVAHFRYGVGGAKITFAELLDEDLQPIQEVTFNQSVLIKIYFETSIQAEVSCNYYVMDDKKSLILGAGLRLLGEPLIIVKIGGRYVVTYRTRLPLHEGNYSIQLQISMPIVLGHTASFLDVIDDALVFKMSSRDGARIWTKAYVDNEVEIAYC